MKEFRLKRSPKGMNNQGFSLIELIISIAVLAIIMIPLMNSFVHSMRLNKKAENIQVQSNLAASIMEGLKNLDMEDTIDQFTMPDPFSDTDPFDVISIEDPGGNPLADGIVALSYDAVNDIYTATTPTEGQATYYFAINGIREGSTVYDALITMNSAGLRATAGIMNDYPMPDAINLNERVNGILFSDVMKDGVNADQKALDMYLEWGTNYAETLFYQSDVNYLAYVDRLADWRTQYENAEMNGTTPPPSPTPVTFDSTAPEYEAYCKEEVVKEAITKTMNIKVDQTTDNMLTYKINYKRDWPTDCPLEKEIIYSISSQKYETQLENIYLFYQPSIFKNTLSVHTDDISIINSSPTKAINFFVAEQEPDPIGPLLPHVKIWKTKFDHDNISVFTNLTHSANPLDVVKLIIDDIETPIAGNINTNEIVDSRAEDRIYEAEISIYEYVDSPDMKDKYKNELYDLSSTREN